MRNCFSSVVTQLAKSDQRIVLLSGDIGNKMFDNFKIVAPGRFYNCGISEAAMMSIASGLALQGLLPIVYTIAPFTTTRCLEQIKIGAAYHNLPIIIVGTGSGLSYAELGPTHYSFEDIAVLRSLPGMNILAPADSIELKAHIKAAITSDNPSYIRIGKKGEPDLFAQDSNLGIGKSNLIRNGTDLIIIGIGPILNEALKAAYKAESIGISVAVASAGCIKPLDTEFLKQMSISFKTWISLEEHSIIGGLGTTLLEWTNENHSHVEVRRLGIPDKFIHELGSQEFIRRQIGIDCDGIFQTILSVA